MFQNVKEKSVILGFCKNIIDLHYPIHVIKTNVKIINMEIQSLFVAHTTVQTPPPVELDVPFNSFRVYYSTVGLVAAVFAAFVYYD